MAKSILAEKPFILERTKDDEVTMHFRIHATPAVGGWAAAGPPLAAMMLFFGWFPGAAFSMLLTGEDINIPLLLVGWGACIAIPIFLARRSDKKLRARGSQFTRLIFNRDTVQTTTNSLLSRTDIEGSFWQGADTSFTYKSEAQRKVRQSIADEKARSENAVGVNYGTQEVMLTHQTLTQLQAQKIADAVAAWVSNPNYLLNVVDNEALRVA